MERNKLSLNPSEVLRKEWLREQGYQYAWVQKIGSVKIGEIDDVVLQGTIDDLLEARFFNATKELHLYREDDGLSGVVTAVQDTDKYIDEVQKLRKSFGSTVTVRSFLDYDEDGQAFVAYSVLAGFERGGSNA